MNIAYATLKGLEEVIKRYLISLFVAWILDDYFQSFYPLSNFWMGRLSMP